MQLPCPWPEGPNPDWLDRQLVMWRGDCILGLQDDRLGAHGGGSRASGGSMKAHTEMELHGALDPHLACHCQASDVDTLGHHNPSMEVLSRVQLLSICDHCSYEILNNMVDKIGSGVKACMAVHWTGR